VSPRGIFHDAGVLNRDLLLEFNGQKLDRFGQTVPHGEMRERMNIYDMAERLPIGSEIKLTVWRDKASKTLTAIFKDDPKHLYPVRYFHEPICEKVEYEVFGGLVVMELTSNHLAKLGTDNTGLLKYDDDSARMESKLLITAILEQSKIPQWSIQAGDIITKLNGNEVKTLADFREHFEPSGAYWTVETDASSLIVLDFKQTLASEAELAQIHNYMPSAAVLRTIKKMLPAAAAEQGNKNEKNKLVDEVVPPVPVAPKTEQPAATNSNANRDQNPASSIQNANPSLPAVVATNTAAKMTKQTGSPRSSRPV
jgi:hypothetical protein